MKILFIAPRLPVPADTGGKIRTLNILKQLAKYADISLVCFSFDDKDSEYSKALKEYNISSIHLVPLKEPKLIQKLITVLFNSKPYSMLKYNDSGMKNKLIELKNANNFDAVHFDHLHMSHYQECFPNIPCILDEHNVEYKIVERCIPVEQKIWKKYIFWLQASRLKTFETSMVKNFSGCLAVSKDDKLLLNNLSNNTTPVYVIPNGVDIEYFTPSDKKIKVIDYETSLVFTGSMDWLPNYDAVIYFCEKILPIVWSKKSEVKFYIVGKNPSNEVKQLAKKDSRVIVTGRVDEVKDYINNAKIFVVPIRVGGGTRLKILEAMSMKKAVVSTSIGAEGINYRNQKNILIADTPVEFADKIISLLNNELLISQIGQEAREAVCREYDWDIIGRRLKEIYEKHIKK